MDYLKVLRSWPSWPNYGQEELDAVSEVLKSNQLFAADRVKYFEKSFGEFLGVEHVIAMGNATQALHLSLAACNVGAMDEVIVTNCSWISTASCILMQNAIPVFVDIEGESLGPDPEAVRKAITPRTKAIITVHILGYPSRIEELRKIADEYSLYLIEDASHAPGATINGRNLGTFGDISVFSFHQRKAISAGEGGVACTRNSSLAEDLRRLRSFGPEELSYNYRMTEFSAALAQIGLSKIISQNELRANSAKTLSKLMQKFDWVRVRLCEPNSRGAYYAVAIELNLKDSSSQELLKRMVSHGVPMRSMFPPLNLHPHFNQSAPARGNPWQHPTYDGVMKGVKYESLNFPVSYQYCLGRVLELYTHPGTTLDHLLAFVQVLENEYSTLKEVGLREDW
jgi:perosamine synthetase